VITYTTCRSCGRLLHTTDGDTTHPLCEPKPTKAERLAEQWLTAVTAGDEFTADAHEYDIDILDATPPRLKSAALRYAGWGWPVFPLKPRSKQPATTHGFKDATTDSGRVAAWWTRHPDANIGLPTGAAFDVIDIDIPDGIRAFTRLSEQNHAVHGHAATASGGVHLYITPTGRGNHTRWSPGVDYRGIGGYVVAPPSTLGARARAWSWVSAPSPVITGTGDTYGVK
jgi:hypothetical protein